MIRFINHASFMITRGETSLVCDPWIKGTAFDNGWNLIVEEDHPALETIDYIWYSHEHPDHFSIGFLKAIPEERRAGITVLYQETADGRVLDFCRKLGFATKTLPDGEPLDLGDGIAVTCGRVPFYDSWLYIDTPEFRLLNSNDCILESPDKLSLIQRYVKSCDILFTQFSYANWQDRRSRPESRRQLAAEKLARVKMQAEAFSPKFVVPFATFVYFSHVENAYMNAEINTPETAVRFIEENCEAAPILLRPNEEWDGLTARSNLESIAYWKGKYAAAIAGEMRKAAKTFAFAALKEKADAMIMRVRSRNNFALIKLMQRVGLIRPVAFRLTDSDETVTFDWIRGLQRIGTIQEGAIQMHSESLAFIFDYDFGVDTVNVNARFETDMAGKRRMVRLFSVLALNNTGRFLSLKRLGGLLNPDFLRQGLRTVGLVRT